MKLDSRPKIEEEKGKNESLRYKGKKRPNPLEWEHYSQWFLGVPLTKGEKSGARGYGRFVFAIFAQYKFYP